MLNALLFWSIALTVLVVLGVVWILDLQARLRHMQQESPKQPVNDTSEVTSEISADLGTVLDRMNARLVETTARTERLVAHAQEVDSALLRTVQGMGLVRFRAFQDTGGDQSFSLALTDGEGHGAVVSALYGRGATRIYAKPVTAWHSSKALSDEEQRALQQAHDMVAGVEKAEVAEE